MEEPQTLADVIDILEEQGMPEEDIEQMVLDLNNAAFLKLQSDAEVFFEDGDFDAIEACETDEEADAKIKELYQLRVGKDADQVVQELIDIFAQSFLEEYQKNQPAA